MDPYKEKYQKYKAKYLELKKVFGGAKKQAKINIPSENLAQSVAITLTPEPTKEISYIASVDVNKPLIYLKLSGVINTAIKNNKCQTVNGDFVTFNKNDFYSYDKIMTFNKFNPSNKYLPFTTEAMKHTASVKDTILETGLFFSPGGPYSRTIFPAFNNGRYVPFIKKLRDYVGKNKELENGYIITMAFNEEIRKIPKIFENDMVSAVTKKATDYVKLKNIPEKLNELIDKSTNYNSTTLFTKFQPVIGGKTNMREGPIDSVIREAKEETGIMIKKENIKDLGDGTFFYRYNNDRCECYTPSANEKHDKNGKKTYVFIYLDNETDIKTFFSKAVIGDNFYNNIDYHTVVESYVPAEMREEFKRIKSWGRITLAAVNVGYLLEHNII